MKKEIYFYEKKAKTGTGRDVPRNLNLAVPRCHKAELAELNDEEEEELSLAETSFFQINVTVSKKQLYI
jgi:hypothetical protein